MKPTKYVRERQGWWHYRFVVNGQEYTGNTGLAAEPSNRKRAEAIAISKRERIQRAESGAEPKPFADAAAEFLQWAEDVEYRQHPNTAARLVTSFASLIHFFSVKAVQDIDAAAIERYKGFRFSEHKVRDITVRHDLHALSVFFRKFAIKQGWAESNPVKLVSIPSDIGAIREHVLTAEEEEKYFAAAEKLHRQHVVSHPDAQPNVADIACLMLEQGCRPEELTALRKDDFDRANSSIKIRGGKSRAAKRTIYLTETSMAVIERRMEKVKGPWLFPSPVHQGKHMTKWSATHDRICIEAGVSFVIYDLRHTFATRALAAGLDTPTVAAILGHEGLRTISRYVHPLSEAQRAGMERFQEARRKLKRMKKVG